MPNRLRRILFNWPAITAAGLFALYLAMGLFALPAVVKWQLEKQVPEKLGHRISVGEVRFNPFSFRFEVADLALSGPEGRPMLGFGRLLVDFELRSAIDRAWTFSQATLERPVLHFDLGRDGRHNFSALLERLRDQEHDQESVALPRLLVNRAVLADGRIEFSDALLEAPQVARIEPLRIEIDGLSTLPAQAARYRLSARTSAGESLETAGELALNPVALKGKLALSGIQAKTLARGLSRLAALGAPAGQADLAASFELAVDRKGTLSGTAQDVELGVTGLSLSAAGAAAPLVAIETLSLEQGRIDLARRVAAFARLRLAKGSIAASMDEQGRLDWAKLARVAASPQQTGAGAAPVRAAAAPPAAAPASGEQRAAAPGLWRVSAASAEIADLAVKFSDAASGSSASIGTLALEMSPQAEFGPAGARIVIGKSKLSTAGARFEGRTVSLGAPSAVIEAGGMTMIAADRNLKLALAAPRVAAPEGLSARRGDATLQIRGISIQGGRVALESADASVSGEIDEPNIAVTGVSIGGSGQSAQLREGSFEGKHISFKDGAGRMEFGLERLRGVLAELQLTQGAGSVTLRGASIAGEKLGVAQADARVRVDARAARVSVSGLGARQGPDRIALQEASFEAKGMSGSTGGGSAGAEARFEEAVLRLAALGVVAQGASAETGGIGSASFGAKALRLALSEGPPAVSADGLHAAVSGAVLRSPAEAAELLRLGRATLSGGVLRMDKRLFSAEAIALADGKVHTGFDAQGRFNWLSLFGGAAAPQTASSPPAARAAAMAPASGEASPEAHAPAAAWRLALKTAELDRFAVAFQDSRGSPALAIGLDTLRARATGLDTGGGKRAQIELEANVAGGGRIEARGQVRPDSGMTDLKLTLEGIALAPLQRYLSEFAELRLASGALSSEGRLRYGDIAGAGAKLAYEGSVAVDRLLLEEVKPSRPFLSWESVASRDVALTLEPNRLHIGELRVERPSGRLIIAEDQTVNLMDVLNKPGGGDSPGAGEGAREGAQPESTAPGEEVFPVSVARVRVAAGELEFADLSLRPKFGVRMHGLKGVITGLGTDAKRSAKLQLDARVDRYGSAKIRGQLNVLEPGESTDIGMVFRNLEMTRLSPYVAKFAGYRIASGRLALDLRYKVSNRRLMGENKIVLNQVELGEKVDSPGAPDLPLDLAIAVLKDSEGVIDIELPVSGDLSDPKFDYGAVIGKALGNLVGGIVTAPFRALGALFGGGEQKLGAIEFEPGSDAISPPESHKLETVARALRERPALVLVVPPTYAAEEDAPALKSLAVRTDIARRMAVELAPGEDPGPLDAADPGVQRAVEAAFSQRYAPEVLDALKRRAIAAAAPAGGPAAGAAKSAKPQRAAPEFYQGLVDRMIEEEPVSEAMLASLGARRSEAIVHELTTAGGVPAARVALGEVRKAAQASDTAVALRLELEAAR